MRYTGQFCLLSHAYSLTPGGVNPVPGPSTCHRDRIIVSMPYLICSVAFCLNQYVLIPLWLAGNQCVANEKNYKILT